MNKQEEQFFQERGFGKVLGLGKKPCIIVIDMIKGFTDPSLPLGSKMDQEVQNINRVIKAGRESGLPIIFTTIAYRDTPISAKLVWRRKMEGLNTLISGMDAVQVDPRLDFRESDELIEKSFASAFFGTNLISFMNSNRIDTLIVTGCTTSGCVRATVVDAVQYGYIPIVIEDAVADRSQMSHQQSLFDMKQKYADVVLTQDVVNYLSAHTNSLKSP